MHIYNDNNKQTFWQNWKKTLQTNIAVNGLYDTKLCGPNTSYSVTRIIRRNVGLVFFLIYLNFCNRYIFNFTG